VNKKGPRGVIEIADCWISPSNEDDVTFTMLIASGDTFRFRGNSFRTTIFILRMNVMCEFVLQLTMLKRDRNGSINYVRVPDRMLLIS
jgi:hypothetical protein